MLPDSCIDYPYLSYLERTENVVQQHGVGVESKYVCDIAAEHAGTMRIAVMDSRRPTKTDVLYTTASTRSSKAAPDYCPQAELMRILDLLERNVREEVSERCFV